MYYIYYTGDNEVCIHSVRKIPILIPLRHFVGKSSPKVPDAVELRARTCFSGIVLVPVSAVCHLLRDKTRNKRGAKPWLPHCSLMIHVLQVETPRGQSISERQRFPNAAPKYLSQVSTSEVENVRGCHQLEHVASRDRSRDRFLSTAITHTKSLCSVYRAFYLLVV